MSLMLALLLLSSASFVRVDEEAAKKPDGSFPPEAAAQMQQCLENVRGRLESAGLTVQHLVYAHVYMTDPAAYDEMNRVWNSYFAGNRPPARAVVGVARIANTSPIRISAIAVTELRSARVVRPRGYSMHSAIAPTVRAGERVYISGVLGRRADTNRMPNDPDGQVKLAVEHLRMLAEPAGRQLRDLSDVTVFVTQALDRSAVEKRLRQELPRGFLLTDAAWLPLGANIEITAGTVK